MATPFLAGKGWPGDPHRFVTWWRRTHFEDSMIDRGHTSYRQIGRRAVSQVMRRAGIDHTQDEVRWLVSCIERLKPFPDVLEALGRLHERYRLDDRGIRPQRARIVRYKSDHKLCTEMYTAARDSYLND